MLYLLKKTKQKLSEVFKRVPKKTKDKENSELGFTAIATPGNTDLRQNSEEEEVLFSYTYVNVQTSVHEHLFALTKMVISKS